MLRAVDHDDPEGERVLSALGAERCTCLDVLDAWERHRGDPRVLVLACRGPADQFEEQPDGRSRRGYARVQFIGSRPAPAPQISDAARAENDLTTLLRLGGGLQDRLVATVAAAWQERLGQPDDSLARVRPQLHAALHGRALATIRTWLGASGVELQLRMIDEAEQPQLVREHGMVRAELPFGWLAEVWAKGIATIWGRFCIAASTPDGQSWTLLTVGPDFGAPAPITVQLAPSDRPWRAARRAP